MMQLVLSKEGSMQAKIIKLHHKTRKKLITLKRKAEQDREYRVAKRIHSVLLNSEEKTSGEISRLLGLGA